MVRDLDVSDPDTLRNLRRLALQGQIEYERLRRSEAR
jgi:hypothetical protein